MTAGGASQARWFARGWLRWSSAARRAGGTADFAVLTPLLELLTPAAPPMGLLARIENRIDTLDRVHSVAETRNARAQAGRHLLSAALAGALVGAAAMALVVVTGSADMLRRDTPVPLAILAGGDGMRVLRAEAIGGGRYLRLEHSGSPAPADRALELWVIAMNDGVPRSLGLLAAKGRITILPLASAIGPGDVLAVSEEPAGGSPAAGPTGPVLISAVVSPAG